MEIVNRRVGCKWEELDIGQEKYPIVPTDVFVDGYLGNVRRKLLQVLKITKVYLEALKGYETSQVIKRFAWIQDDSTEQWRRDAALFPAVLKTWSLIIFWTNAQ